MLPPLLVLFDFFFQAEDGIRDLVRSRGLGDVYKRQGSENGLGSARSAPLPPNLGGAECFSPQDWGGQGLSLIHI